MARINLLPWREEQRKQKKREFGVVAGGSVLLMAGAVLYAHIHISGMISHQESRNRYLEGQIQLVEKKIREIRDLEKKRKQLVARMRVIEKLQRNRPEVVHLFQELVELIPEGLHFTELTQKGSSITIKGVAESNARVSSLMRALDQSAWFANPKLEVIQSGAKGVNRTRDFTLQVKQASPSEGETANGS